MNIILQIPDLYIIGFGILVAVIAFVAISDWLLMKSLDDLE